MLEKGKKYVGKEKVFDALITDLSKAFDCLDHELLAVKLNAYRFDLSGLRLIHNYLSNRELKLRCLIAIV